MIYSTSQISLNILVYKGILNWDKMLMFQYIFGIKMFKRSALTIYLMLVISLLVVNSKSNMYQSIQNLTVGSSKIETMDITGNNDILAVGTYDNKVILYKNNDTRYQPYQEILFSSQVEAVDITNDGKYLLVVEYNGNAKIYKHNNTRDIFIVLQQLSSFSFTWSGAISDDNEWIIVGDQFGSVFIYKYNGTKFNQHQTIIDTSENIRQISGSANFQYFVASTRSMLRIYKKENQNFNIFQELQFQNSSIERRAHMTDDFQYITTQGQDNRTNVYEFNDNYVLNISAEFEGSHLYSSISPKSTLIGVSGTPTVVAQSETEFDIYPESSYHIFSKDEKYFITADEFGRVFFYENINSNLTDTSLVCDETNFFYENNGQCLLCNPNNNKFLLVRINTTAISSTQCVDCDIEGCQICDSLTVCKNCTDGYYQDGLICTKNFQLSLILIIVGLIIILCVIVILCAVICVLLSQRKQKEKEDAKKAQKAEKAQKGQKGQKVGKDNENMQQPIASNRQLMKQEIKQPNGEQQVKNNNDIQYPPLK